MYQYTHLFLTSLTLWWLPLEVFGRSHFSFGRIFLWKVFEAKFLKQQTQGKQLCAINKRSLGRGKVFTYVCLSTGGSLYDVTSCLADWSHVLSRESLSRRVSVQGVSFQGGLCPGGLCPRGFYPRGLCPGSLCPGGSVWRGLSGRTPWTKTPLYNDARAVCILLECFLVCAIFAKYFKNPCKCQICPR